ncbi:MAG: hypothetical protein KKC68_06625 [Candidatus Thermoplasmatota archaeon]|nr:hypothetical protein [Candidatus Thermoplasmatota archaeon]
MYIQTTECQLCSHIETHYKTSEGNPCDATGTILKKTNWVNEPVELPNGNMVWICSDCRFLLGYILSSGEISTT